VTAPARRPWHRRKRTWAAIALWLTLPVLYVLADGPAGYCVARGWLPLTVYETVFGPAWRPAVSLGGPPDLFVRYHFWWVDRGRAAAAPN